MSPPPLPSRSQLHIRWLRREVAATRAWEIPLTLNFDGLEFRCALDEST
ncbi:unnamed protein product [Arabidopsis lyrata]|nr:unnamed protein product [Arabidopsis lyrata]